jgi:HlyD family secretion protein
VDESDVGRIAKGQPVTFTVDAHPSRTFAGVVAQIRLQPQTVQNVVTYAVLIDAPNPDLSLKPGMTANLTIEVARRDDALRVPTAALRFRPAAVDLSGPSSRAGPPEDPISRESQVWRSENGELTRIPVKPGLTDGQFTEIVEGSLSEGDTVAVRQSTPDQSVRPVATGSPFQFMQPQMSRPR